MRVLPCVIFCRVAHCLQCRKIHYSKDFKMPVSWSWCCSAKLSTTVHIHPLLLLPTVHSLSGNLVSFVHFRGFHKGCTALASGNLLLVVTPGTVQPPLGVKCNLLSRKLFLLSQVCLSFSSFLYDHKRLCSKHWLKDLILDHGPVPWRGLSL